MALVSVFPNGQKPQGMRVLSTNTQSNACFLIISKANHCSVATHPVLISPGGVKTNCRKPLKSVKTGREKSCERLLFGDLITQQLSITPDQTVVFSFPLHTSVFSLYPSYTELYHGLANILHAESNEGEAESAWHWQRCNVPLPKKRQPEEASPTHKIVRIDKKGAIAAVKQLLSSRLISIVHGEVNLEA